MALQGTLDTFELPDVLRLLSSTKKTGCLHLRSLRGDGRVWVDGGQVVGAEADTAPGGGDTDVLFELLRATEGGFSFDAASTSPAPHRPAALEPLLAEAEARLVEWRAIEAVVPSLSAWVSLAPELAGPDTRIDAATWKLVVAVGSGVTVAELGHVLGLAEVPVCRIVRDLVELGLGVVTVGSPTSSLNGDSHAATDSYVGGGFGTVAEVPSTPFDAPAPPPPPAAELPSWASTSSFTAVEPAPEPFATAFEPAAELRPSFGYDGLAAPEQAPALPPPIVPAEAFAGADPAEADEVARQLAMLSPRAAQAVAAAARADTDAEREAALAAVDDEGEPINRGLLLKFLSSVRS